MDSPAPLKPSGEPKEESEHEGKEMRPPHGEQEQCSDNREARGTTGTALTVLLRAAPNDGEGQDWNRQHQGLLDQGPERWEQERWELLCLPAVVLFFFFFFLVLGFFFLFLFWLLCCDSVCGFYFLLLFSWGVFV